MHNDNFVQAVIEKTNVNPSEVRDIVVGTVLALGSQRASECRMAAFYAGFPGLQAVADVAAAIKAGFYDIGTEYGTRPKLSSPHGYNFRKCCKLLRRNKVDSHRKAAAATAS